MREILFRGKRIDSGEWVEGGLVKVGGYPPFGIHVPVAGPNDLGGLYHVHTETVGQYTGLKDKNGKRIFEGDICNVGNLLYKVEFKHSSWWFTILSNKVYCCPAFNSHCGEYCEVIGNIHDNPELLEAAHE